MYVQGAVGHNTQLNTSIVCSTHRCVGTLGSLPACVPQGGCDTHLATGGWTHKGKDTKMSSNLRICCCIPWQAPWVGAIHLRAGKGSIALSQGEKSKLPPASQERLGRGLTAADSFQDRKNEMELFWLCLPTAELGNRTQGDAQGEEDVLLCGLLFWALFIWDISQPGRQSMEAI